MRRVLLIPPLLSLAAFPVGGIWAQSANESAPVSTAPAPPVISANSDPTARGVSPTTAAKLAALAPKFIPPSPSGNQPAPSRPELDQPKNGIIRLPAYTVWEAKPREFKQREMLTSKGRLDLVLKRHPGLYLDPFYWLGLGTGGALLAEEERLERLAEMTDALSLLNYSDTPLLKDVKQKAQQAYIRPSEWVDTGGSHQGR